MAKPDPIPDNEAARIATLHALQILDTPPDERFDRITRVAAELFDVPIALVTLVDESRVWFKSVVGLPVREIPREQSLCLYSISQSGLFVVEDTRQDPCFCDNALVCGPPNLTFYAGRALEVDGHKLGNFCILDTKPRTLNDRQRALLEDLGVMAENELKATYLSKTLADRMEELELANRQLMAADRHKDEFLSIISHELRTPLNFIMSSVSILTDEMAGPLTPLQREFTENVATGADRMLVLVNNLLDMSRMATGKFALAPAPVVLQELVRDAVTMLAAQAEAKGLSVMVQVPELPLVADAPRLVQVLANLVDNAVKFTDTGGQVRISARSEGHDVLVEVADTGIGIPEDAHDMVFEKFRQVDMRLERQASGVGLGLSIAKAIVLAHGGSIGVDSRPGHGSTFWFRLPMVTTSSAELSADRSLAL